MSEHYHAVIMAGGSGTRLWPLSRQALPKQMLQLGDERSLFQIAVERLEGLFPPERILVVSPAEQVAKLQALCDRVPPENYVVEPEPRGTAAAIALAALVLQERDPQAVMAVLTADHYIKDEDLFRRILAAGRQVAEENFLVTLGIRPTYPATGYGYIHQGASLGSFGEFEAFRVLRFKEKPGLETAGEMLASGDHVWNSGMFIWRLERILAEFERQMPELHAVLKEIEGLWGKTEEGKAIQDAWGRLAPQTVDYGVMESAAQVAVIPAEGLGWNDVGSWKSLFEVLPTDQDGNIIIGAQHIDLGSRDSLVFEQDDERLVVTIGLEDLVVVDTEDVLLVCHREQAEQIRKVIELLKEQKEDKHL